MQQYKNLSKTIFYITKTIVDAGDNSTLTMMIKLKNDCKKWRGGRSDICRLF